MNGVWELLRSIGDLFTWWVIVAPWEQALRVRGGKRSMFLRPGVHLRIPFWDRVYLQSIRRMVAGATGQTITARDGKVLTVRIVVEYQIDNLQTVYDRLQNPQDIIRVAAQAAVVEFVGEHDCAECTARAIGGFVAEAIGSDMADCGLKVVCANVTNLAAVRTYRLISGEGDGGYWEAMDPMKHIHHKAYDN